MHWNGLKNCQMRICMTQKQYISIRKLNFLTENEKKGDGGMT